MTDLYSVLKASIIRRDLRSPGDRQRAYDQARSAMSRKLWSFDPPLSEDEIDARIGLFDSSIDRIERDLEQVFAEGGAAEMHQGMRRESRHPPAQHRHPPVQEGYDERADYMPNYGRQPIARQQDVRPSPAYRTDDYDMPPNSREYDERRIAQDGLGDRAADYGRPPPMDTHPRRRDERHREPDRYDDRYEDPIPPEAYHDESAYRERSHREPAYRPPAYQEPAEWRQAPPAERRMGPQRSPGYRDDRPADDFDDDDYDDDGYDRPNERYSTFDRHDGTRQPATRARQGGRRVVRMLTTAVAGLAVVLIGFNAFVFLPNILDAGTAPSATTPAAIKSEDRLPVAGQPTAQPATRIVSDSATASEIPERNLNVAESLIVFAGRDPTVFEASSNNPIQFDSDAEGGFARISSATSAAGARALIGPGLAERFAGRTIRVTLLARSSPQNGAPAIRFAYQSGVAVSHWQIVDLSQNYGSYGMIWRVPASHESASGDYLLIEPGIPGDGTSTDIRSIKIDILAS